MNYESTSKPVSITAQSPRVVVMPPQRKQVNFVRDDYSILSLDDESIKSNVQVAPANKLL
jgi:hypothetical protein